jgi:predicted AlkP superfamily pyrophosphatase or phosphodiesterase
MHRKIRTKSFRRTQILGLLAWLALAVCGLPASAGPRADHVFIISIDGGKPAVIAESKMPVLKKLAAEGACTWSASTIYPSITLPAHTSMLTGVGPETHNILWNEYLPEKGIVQVPTVFSLAKQAGFSTAMFVGKEKFRHLILPGSVDEFSYDQSASGKIEKSMANSSGKSDKLTEQTVLARIVAADAAAYIKEKKPNLCFIHFTDTDDAGHKYGWGSPEQMKAFADVDAALGVVVDAIHQAGIADDTVIIISADHGGHKKTHGTNTPDDMIIPWVIWGKGVKKDFKIAVPVNICDTAATTLWLFGLSCPDCLGKPVTSAFE